MNFKSAFDYSFGASMSEIRNMLIAAGANSNCISLEWTHHHYALIVFKYACLVRQFPELKKEYWNLTSIINQLKYRYE